MGAYWSLGLVAALVLSGCATGFRAGAGKNRIDVIAHRGASAYAPENTLASFRKAIEMHADWFELDCTLTRDSRLLVIHDDTLDRTTDGKGPVRDKTLAELKQLDAGRWFSEAYAGEKLPTLEESLDLAKGRIGVYVELKDMGGTVAAAQRLLEAAGTANRLTPALARTWHEIIARTEPQNIELAQKTIAAIRERHMERQVVVQSFSPSLCFVLRQEAPGLRVELLGAKDEKHPELWALFLQFAHLLRPAGCNIHYSGVSAETVATLHQLPGRVAVWTVDNPEQMRGLVSSGVDAIITNKPDVCLATLRDLGKH